MFHKQITEPVQFSTVLSTYAQRVAFGIVLTFDGRRWERSLKGSPANESRKQSGAACRQYPTPESHIGQGQQFIRKAEVF